MHLPLPPCDARLEALEAQGAGPLGPLALAFVVPIDNALSVVLQQQFHLTRVVAQLEPNARGLAMAQGIRQALLRRLVQIVRHIRAQSGIRLTPFFKHHLRASLVVAGIQTLAQLANTWLRVMALVWPG